MSGYRGRQLAIKIPHYFVLTLIGVLALFPIYFMAVTGLKNGIQLQQNPFNVAISPPQHICRLDGTATS